MYASRVSLWQARAYTCLCYSQMDAKVDNSEWQSLRYYLYAKHPLCMYQTLLGINYIESIHNITQISYSSKHTGSTRPTPRGRAWWPWQPRAQWCCWETWSRHPFNHLSPVLTVVLLLAAYWKEVETLVPKKFIHDIHNNFMNVPNWEEFKCLQVGKCLKFALFIQWNTHRNWLWGEEIKPTSWSPLWLT